MSLSDTEIVTINKKELDRLQAADLKLECLMEAGVDNWEYYDDAMIQYHALLDERASDE